MLEKSALSARQQDYLGTIHKSADSLLAIINDILDFSKIEAGKLSLEHTPLNLHDLIEDVQTLLAPMAQERGLEQAAIIYSDVPVNLLGDPLRIRQVLTNLLSNAIKFTEQGSVVVRAMLEEDRGAEAIIKLTVTDTGNGLSPEAQKNLFRAFTQADQSARRQEGGTAWDWPSANVWWKAWAARSVSTAAKARARLSGSRCVPSGIPNNALLPIWNTSGAAP